MRTVTATQASRGFSELLDAVERGESVAITRGGRTVAVIGPTDFGTGRGLRKALAGLPPLDDDFLKDIEAAKALLTDWEYPWEDD